MRFNHPIGVWGCKADPTLSELRQAQRLQDLATTRLEVAFRGRITRILNKYTDQAARAVIASPASAPTLVLSLDDMQAELGAVLVTQYNRTANAFAESFWAGLEKSWQIPQTKDQGGIFAEQLRVFVSNNAANRVSQITDTTRSLIRGAIQQSIEEQLGPAGMAQLIVIQSGGAVAAKRADMIARTETHTAAQFGQDAAANATGLEFRKFWIAVDDGRTRDDHKKAEADSRDRIIRNHEPFRVGGEALMFPGDPTGSAGQIINCRCAATRRPIL